MGAKRKEEPLSRAEAGILHYLNRGWLLDFEAVVPFIEIRGEFDCCVPEKAAHSLKTRGLLETKRGTFSKWTLSEKGYYALQFCEKKKGKR